MAKAFIFNNMNIQIKKLNKLLPIILIGMLFLTGCSADDPAYVYDTDPINIEGQVNTIFPNGTTDALTGAVVTVEYEHHEIHESAHYYVSGFETESSASNVTFGVTSPDSIISIHMSFEVSAVSQLEMYIYEGSVFVGGTAITPVNNNRNSTTTSTLVCAKDPAITDYGTLIYSQSSRLAGAPPAKADLTAMHDRNREIILKRNTKYTFVMVSRDDNNIVNYIGEWYEE